MVLFYFPGKITENPLPVIISYANFFILFLASISDTSTMIGLNEGYRNTFLEKTRLGRATAESAAATRRVNYGARN